MHKSNEALGVAFDLPEMLTVRALDDYQIGMQRNIAALNGAPLTMTRLNAVAYGTAVNIGLITNWQCEAMPLEPENVDQADARIINFVGATVREFIAGITEIPLA